MRSLKLTITYSLVFDTTSSAVHFGSFCAIIDPFLKLSEGTVSQVLGLLVDGLSLERSASIPRSMGSDLGMVVLSSDLSNKKNGYPQTEWLVE